MKLKIEHDLKRLKKDLGRMAKTVAPEAAAIAINRVTDTVRSVAVKSISKKTSITPQKRVGKDITYKYAIASNLRAYVDAKAGRARNLASFVTPARRKPSAGPGKPQFFRKKDGRKRKRGKGARPYKYKGVLSNAWGKAKQYKSAYIIMGKNNNPIVVVRKGDGRDAQTKVLHGPSVRQEFIKKPMRDSLIKKSNERFPIELKRALAQLIRKHKNK